MEKLDSDDLRRARELLGLDPERERLYGDRGRREDWRWSESSGPRSGSFVRWHEVGGHEKPRLRRRHAEGLGMFLAAEYQQGGGAPTLRCCWPRMIRRGIPAHRASLALRERAWLVMAQA